MYLYAPESVYQLDRNAVEIDRLPEIELMGRAGRAVWREIESRWPQTTAITVLAGAGNNGGDAFVVADCALKQGLEVELILLGDLERQSETSRHYRRQWLDSGGVIESWSGQGFRGELIVDGLMGIGLARDLDETWQALIDAVNHARAPIVAIDIPSGLNAATGVPQPVAVAADLTVTFIGRKTGQYLARGPDHCGELIFDDLGTSPASRAGVPTLLEVIDSCRLPATRRKDSHKNHFGNLLIVGGGPGMCGAVALAGRAALRSGVGLVTILVHPDCVAACASTPEIMVQDWSSLDRLLPQASVVLVGPGLGRSPQASGVLKSLTRAEQPLVVDADGLDAGFLEAAQSAEIVITPHPGEAARLLSTSTAEVQRDRIASCRQLSQRFEATCVLKGSGSLIARGDSMALNHRGHAGMATAGMGDVLAGLLSALLGQGMDAFEAARSAVFLHALAAEDFTRDNDPIGLIASDIIEAIPRIIRQQRGRDG